MHQNLKIDPKIITEQLYKKNVELLNQKRRSESLLYSVAEAVIAVNQDFEITIFNRMAENLSGKRHTDILGKNIKEVITLHTEEGAEITPEKYCFVDSKETLTVDSLVLKGLTRNHYVNLTSTLIDQADGSKESLITLTDVTKERELDKSKDDFISVASHELRTPMTIIKSYLWMLDNNKAGELNEKQKGYLKKTVTSTERMINLINDMLNISRVEQGRLTFKIKKMNIVPCLKDALTGFDLKAQEKGIGLEVLIDVPDDTSVYSDEDKTKEIIINLVGNAVKFTKTGSVVVKLQNLTDVVKISVEDTGVGISPENIEKLFQKFERLDSSYTTVAESSGTGLGLYIVKMYVEALHGQVGVDSAGVGKGSIFWFTLPVRNLSDNPIEKR